MGLAAFAIGASVAPAATVDHAATATATETPPRPYLISHDKRIRAARTGYCEDASAPGCAFPAVFLTTRPLPVHRSGGVLINTRTRAQEVRVFLECGGERNVKRLSGTKWRFRVSARQGRRNRCDHGEFTVRYGPGTQFAGGLGAYQFSIRPHRH